MQSDYFRALAAKQMKTEISCGKYVKHTRDGIAGDKQSSARLQKAESNAAVPVLTRLPPPRSKNH